LITVAGAGMAGLVAAVRLRELDRDVRVLEKGSRPGGSMLLSSCVIWRYRSFDDFRAECPGGDAKLQRLVHERFDDALAWLVGLGARPVWDETGNPRTIGKRFDPRQLTETLLASAGAVELETALPGDAEPPLILATGGFPVRLAREQRLRVRSNPWSKGDGIDFARERGAALTDGLDEFYGRALPAEPAQVGEADFVPFTQLYGSFATVVNEDGEEFFFDPVSWSETNLVQEIARQPGGTAWYVLEPSALTQRVRDRTVADMVEAARAAGGEVRQEPNGRVAVHVGVGVTHTLGGLRVDTRAHVLDDTGVSISGLYAAGVDVGGISTGGYSSGLATALVLGLVAAEAAAE
jgi:succinate dehydrogenase/fumarate reductase flavoprotein subunit